MIEKDNKNLTIKQQCELLGISRSSYYYEAKGYTKFDMLLMSLLDKLHTAIPSYGSRKLTVEINKILTANFIENVNRKRIIRYMKILDIEAIYQKPNLSRLGKAEYVYPYLLRNLEITHPNQVWSSDITYVPFENGFMYVYAIIDWYTRTILAFEVSDSMNNDFVINTVNTAFEKYDKPEIMNSDQGSHFTSKEYTELLKNNNVKISMDGKARALDNIFIERFWRTLKYEYIFLYDFGTPQMLVRGITNFIDFYNNIRPHQALEYKAPMQLYNNKKYEINIKNNLLFDHEYKEFNYNKDIQKVCAKYVS